MVIYALGVANAEEVGRLKDLLHVLIAATSDVRNVLSSRRRSPDYRKFSLR